MLLPILDIADRYESYDEDANLNDVSESRARTVGSISILNETERHNKMTILLKRVVIYAPRSLSVSGPI